MKPTKYFKLKYNQGEKLCIDFYEGVKYKKQTN
jgi:hypothetical protein